ncbi:NAD(P)H-dependent nitrite reductase, small subunit [Saccharomonospora marina XMU15]|uniref:NAD(P)H-dependent nitrite reductase, small subunit n=1 Tax=Saccharomonospora marina XMU15 TaxID=882083 RepID=H5XAB8_9PSEU|nr:nitrite reductase small subunit NirD [Saccharomonospora marina]EHR49283.1 NAD(P)H-dependent nitrite reductase, small subunit [Saccharomonospora marina XMU15]
MTAMAEQTWVAVCEADSVLPAYGVAALLPGGEQVAVFRTEDDEFYALSNHDPFSGAGVLSRGIVGDSGGVPVVASPIYKQRFDLRDGSCIDDDHVRVRTYPVRVSDGIVHVGSP